MSEFIWKTRDGKKIPISKMSDRHLLYTHRMLRNQLVDCKDMISFGDSAFAPRGEIASADFDQALDENFERMDALHSIIGTFTKELRRRGLAALPSKKMMKFPSPKSVEHMPGGGTIMEF